MRGKKRLFLRPFIPYLKGLFPKVEPTELLDVLTSNCYNVKDACEELIEKGHAKKDSSLTPPKLKDERKSAANLKAIDELRVESPRPSPSIIRPKNITEDFKKKVKAQLNVEFPVLTPTVVNMALKTAYYDEERARQILNKMDENEQKAKETLAQITPKLSRRSQTPPTSVSGTSPPRLRKERTIRPVLHRPRVPMAWTISATPMSTRSSSEEDDSKFKSNNCTRSKGPNFSLHSGPNDSLLLCDYVPWHGPNVENLRVTKSLAKGPNLSLRKGPCKIALGPNPSLHKGSSYLAKGSQFIKSIKKEVTFSTKRI